MEIEIWFVNTYEEEHRALVNYAWEGHCQLKRGVDVELVCVIIRSLFKQTKQAGEKTL